MSVFNSSSGGGMAEGEVVYKAGPWGQVDVSSRSFAPSELRTDFDGLMSVISRLIPNDRIALAVRHESADRFDWRVVTDKRVPTPTGQQSLILSEFARIFDGTDAIVLTGRDWEQNKNLPTGLAWLSEAGTKTLLAIPVTWSGEPAGFLGVCSDSPSAYGALEIEKAREVAALISSVIAADGFRRELAREITELNALSELGRLLISGDEWTEHIDRCAGLVKRLIDYDRFSISLYEPSTGTIDTAYSSGVKLNNGRGPTRIPMSELQAYFALGEAYLPSAEQMRQLAERVPAVGAVLSAGGFKSLISAPLRWRGTFVGAMQVFSRVENRYAERDRITFDRIANQVSGALAVARLTESLQNDVRERMVLAELSRILSSALDPRDVVDQFSGKLSELLTFDSLFVNIIDYPANMIVDWFTWGTAIPGTNAGNQQPIAGTLTEKIASTRSSFRYSALNEQDAIENIPNSIAGVRVGMHSWLAAPMISNDRVIGTIHLRSSLADAYTERSESILERVASQVAGSFANAIAHSHEAALAEAREKNFLLDVEKQELRRLNEVRDRFLGMVSHELKTPLTSIYAFANILAHNHSENLTDRQINQIRVIQRNSRRLDMMIGDLLDVSRIEQGTFSLVNRPFEARAMLEEVFESIEPILAEKSQVLEFVSELGAVVMVDGDRGRVSQVVANLLSNASKYSGMRDTITVRAEIAGNRFSVAVQDDGVGIDEEEILRIFDPFYRVENDATRRAPGTGIGLFVARTIIEQHGGKIDVQSRPDSGTIVEFWIPIQPTTGAGPFSDG